MELNCPGLHNVAETLKSQSHKLADCFMTSDAFTGIKILIGVDYFFVLFCMQIEEGTGYESLCNQRGCNSVWTVTVVVLVSNNQQFMSACILCENKPNVAELWELDRIGITMEEFPPLER